MRLTYPRIKAEDIIFRELFINAQYTANNGVDVYNSPTIDNGVTLNGTNQYADLADDWKYSFGDSASDNAFSVEAWIIMTDATEFAIISKGVYNTDAEWRLLVDSSDKINWQCFDESVADCYIGRKYDTALTGNEGQVLHIIATYDGGGTSAGCKIYINGSQIDDTDAENNSGSYVAMEKQGHKVQIGRDDTLYANGIILSSMIYNRELIAAEVVDRFTQVTFSEVDVLQLEFFLPLRLYYNNGTSEVTPNLGIIGTDTIKWGDGSTASTYPTLLPNNGASFDGGDYIGLSDAFDVTRTESYTFGCLAKYDQATDKFLFDFRNSSNEGFGLKAQNADFLLFYDAVSTGADGVGDFSDGTWHSVICTLSPSGANTIYSIYVDGLLDVTNTTTSFTDATVDAFIGTERDITDQYIGDIKFPFFWKIALTPTQIKWQHENLFRQFNL